MCCFCLISIVVFFPNLCIALSYLMYVLSLSNMCLAFVQGLPRVTGVLPLPAVGQPQRGMGKPDDPPHYAPPQTPGRQGESITTHFTRRTMLVLCLNSPALAIF